MYRSVDTSIWGDPWVQEELGRDEKLLFLCLFTNLRTTSVGAYQVTPTTLASETGIPATEIPELLKSLEPKVMWWPEHRIIWVRNFFRRQFQKPNAKVMTNAVKVLAELPREVIDTVCQEYPELAHAADTLSIPHPYPTDSLPIRPPVETVAVAETAPGTEPAAVAASSPAPAHEGEAPAEPPVADRTAAAAAVRETAENLGQAPWIPERGDELVKLVRKSFRLTPQFHARDGPRLAELFVRRPEYRRDPPADWFAVWLRWLGSERPRDETPGGHARNGRAGPDKLPPGYETLYVDGIPQHGKEPRAR